MKWSGAARGHQILYKRTNGARTYERCPGPLAGFNSDVISADFSKAKFAVELHEFLDGDGPTGIVPRNPKALLRQHVSHRPDEVACSGDALARLSTGSGQPVTVIDTGFWRRQGTHSLLLLHHIFTSRDAGLDFVPEEWNHVQTWDINSIPQARIVEIDCRKITKNTLWGRDWPHRLGPLCGVWGRADARQEAPDGHNRNKAPI